MIKRIKSLTFLFLISVFARPAPGSDAGFKRLDPHGQMGVAVNVEYFKTHNECKVCHTLNSDGALGSIKEPGQTCSECHNSAPHSGIAEHLRNKKVSCINCHAFHRVDGKNGTPPSGFFKAEKEVSQPNSMIRKNCTDCHKWE